MWFALKWSTITTNVPGVAVSVGHIEGLGVGHDGNGGGLAIPEVTTAGFELQPKGSLIIELDLPACDL